MTDSIQSPPGPAKPAEPITRTWRIAMLKARIEHGREHGFIDAELHDELIALLEAEISRLQSRIAAKDAALMEAEHYVERAANMIVYSAAGQFLKDKAMSVLGRARAALAAGEE